MTRSYASKNAEQLKPSYLLVCWWERKTVSIFVKQLSIPLALNIHLLYGLAFPLLVIYLTKRKLMFTWRPMVNFYNSFIHHIQKLEITHMTFKQKWINYGNIHTMNYYSGINRNKLLIDTATWIDHKLICCEKEVQPPNIYIIWFYLYIILGKAKQLRWKADQWLPGVGW